MTFITLPTILILSYSNLPYYTICAEYRNGFVLNVGSNFSGNKMIVGKMLKEGSSSARNDLSTGKSTRLIGLSVHKYVLGQEQPGNTLAGNL